MSPHNGALNELECHPLRKRQPLNSPATVPKKKKYNKYKIRNKAEKKIKKYNNHYSNELGTAAEVDVDVADDYNTMDEIMRAIM